MGDLGKLLIAVGAAVLVAGVVLVFSSRVNLPIGRLPGDLVFRGRNTTFYVPIVTSIVLSVVLSLVVWIIGRFSR